MGNKLISSLAGAVFIFAASGLAFAADMAVKAPPSAPAPVYNWTGWYAGVNAGGNWGTSDSSTNGVGVGGLFTAPDCFPPDSDCVLNAVDFQNAGVLKTDTSGFVGGGQAGYNWQKGNVVLGLETEFEYFRSAGTSSNTVETVQKTGTLTVTSSMSTNWLFTLRPRLGWAVDNWLVYATGGLAVTDLKPGFSYSDTTSLLSSGAGSFSDTKAGWTVGGGVETMLPDRWVLGVEYLFVKFDNVAATVPVTITPFSPPPQNFSHTADLQANIVRARLSKLF
jgi:outer membrane immunogenic protein